MPETSFPYGQYPFPGTIFIKTDWFFKYGLEEAVLLGTILEQGAQQMAQPECDNPEQWIRLPRHWLQKELGLSFESQRRILRNLAASGAIVVKKMGLPAVRHVQVQFPLA